RENYFDKDKEDPIDAAQMNSFTFNLFGDPTLILSLEDNSFSLSSERYTKYSFEKDLIFIKTFINKGNYFKEKIDFGNLNYVDGGFIVENNSGIFKIENTNFEVILKKIKEDEIIYLYKIENEDKIILKCLSGEGKVFLRFSPNLRAERSKYFDPFRNIAIFEVKENEEIVFNKMDKEKFFIEPSDENVFILNLEKFDYKKDNFINLFDFFIFSRHFGDSKDSVLYNEIFDFDSNGVINGVDLLIFSLNYGKTIKEE
ncbi:MAG: hypothetical protein QMD25_05925, partial [Caldisericia bacterium]|nr:hypothetical protein [Caldisericia bacterium]